MSKVRIHSVNKKMSKQIKNIADNLGMNMNELIKKNTPDFLDKFIDDDNSDLDDKKEIVLYGVGEITRKKISKAARNLGIDESAVLKLIMHEIRIKYKDKTRSFD